MAYKLLLGLFFFLQCTPKAKLVETQQADASAATGETVAQTYRLKMGEPSTKDVLWIVMKNYDLPLSTSESCEGVGTSFEDETLGDYFAGFWQYHNCEDCNNSLDIQIAKGDQPLVESKHWNIRFMINGETEGETWSWGAAFAIEDEGWKIIPSSLRCLGAG